MRSYPKKTFFLSLLFFLIFDFNIVLSQENFRDVRDLNAELEMKLYKIRAITGSNINKNNKILNSPPLIDIKKSSEVKLKQNYDLFSLPEILNILVLGLDKRIKWKTSHADAIHLFSFDTVSGRLTITTIPRGSTGINIPGHPGDYIADAYCYGGRKLMKKIVSNFLDCKIDYIVEFDFSTSMRFLELLGYKGKTTLRFLRHRKSYRAGDFQRCHNQALFMKREMLKMLPFFTKTGGELLLRTSYAIIWTDMAYSTAKKIIMKMIELKLYNHPDWVTLKMKPKFHGKLNQDNIPTPFTVTNRVNLLYNSIASSEKDCSKEFSMIRYLNKIIQKYESLLTKKDELIVKNLKNIFDKKLWYQIEDLTIRKHIHKKLSKLLSDAYRNLGNEFLADKIMREFELSYAIKNIWQLPDYLGTKEVKF